MHIRPATEHDLPTLRAFEQDLIDVERAFDPDLRPEGIHYYDLDDLMASDDSTLLVADDDGAVLACGYAQIRDAKPVYHHARVAYIGFLYVVPAGRGQGLVQRVIDALCEWARGKGLTQMELGVYSDNAPALAAYTRAGFRAVSTTMVMTLDGDD